MKKLIVLLALMIVGTTKSQTLLNSDFENWNTPYDPLSWTGLSNDTLQTNDAYSGNWALKISSMMGCGVAEGLLTNGKGWFFENINGGTPCNYKPKFLTGFYKYTNTESSDTASAIVILKRFNTSTNQNDTVAFGKINLLPSANYAIFNVTINDLIPNLTPDTLLVVFKSGAFMDWNASPSNTINFSFPVLQLDHLALSEDMQTGITEQIKTEVPAELFPNPFSQTAVLKLKIKNENYPHLNLLVFDAQGKKVMRSRDLFDNSFLIDRKELPQGVYTYIVNDENHRLCSGKFIIND